MVNRGVMRSTTQRQLRARWYSTSSGQASSRWKIGGQGVPERHKSEVIAGHASHGAHVRQSRRQQRERTMRLLLLIASLLAFTTATASASWQLIPGKAYDGHVARRSYKEPCWSAATSKCSWEQNQKTHATKRPRN